MSTCTVPTGPNPRPEPKDPEVRAWSDLVAIGVIAKSQGREGEVAVNPLTDFPERFVGLARVYLEGEDGEAVPRAVESARIHKGRPVVKLVGVSGIGEAKALSGKEMRIPSTEVLALPEGSFYHFEMSGLEVIDRRLGSLGTAERVMATGGTDVLVVSTPDGEELLLPLCEEICRRIDPDAGRIEVETPEGLIGLNAN